MKKFLVLICLVVGSTLSAFAQPSGAINVKKSGDLTFYQLRDLPGRWFVQTHNQTLFFDFKDKGQGTLELFCNNRHVQNITTATLGVGIAAGLATAKFTLGTSLVVGFFVDLATSYGIGYLCK